MVFNSKKGGRLKEKNDLLILFTFCMVTDIFNPLINDPDKRLKETK